MRISRKKELYSLFSLEIRKECFINYYLFAQLYFHFSSLLILVLPKGKDTSTQV